MAFASWWVKISICMTIVLFENNCRVEARTAQYLETNEITVGERALSLPSCRPHSICGYLQANARGINHERICACPSSSCPMTWDPFDGHSITQGSDQYKMCDPAPTTLKQCEPRQTAYTSRIIFSKTTDEFLTKEDKIKCICPDTHNYEVANQNFADVDADTELMEFSYICAPLPICRNGDACKTVSEKASTFLVNRKCVCPAEERCATLSEEGTSKTIAMGNGHIQLIRCQRQQQPSPF